MKREGKIKENTPKAPRNLHTKTKTPKGRRPKRVDVKPKMPNRITEPKLFHMRGFTKDSKSNLWHGPNGTKFTDHELAEVRKDRVAMLNAIAGYGH